MSTPERDVIEILTHDHREVEGMFEELESLNSAHDDAGRSRRQDLVDQVTIELVRHSVAEEAEVYPQVAERISDEEATRSRQEHAEAEQTLKRLERLKPDDPSFGGELMTLIREIREHVREEEGQIFPQMRKAFSEDELLDLGRRVERMKRVAPTRPHPSAPDEPPGDKLLGPVTGLVDRMRDALSHRGQTD